MKERGYWQPPNADNLPACKGFYISSKAVYTTADIEKDWDRLLDMVEQKLSARIPTLKKVAKWKSKGMAQSRFVLTADEFVDIIVEDIEGYIAVYALIPEDCRNVKEATDRFFQYVAALRRILTSAYPNHIFQRISSQNIRPIT